MGKCIYQPTGAAREYARWACNLFNGCPHACNYCYCKRGVLKNVLGKDVPTIKKGVGTTEEEALETFKKEIEKYANKIKEQKESLFFSFSTDPLCEQEVELTYACFYQAILKQVPVQILTKAVSWSKGLAWKRLLMFNRDWITIGTTLTGHDEEEPGAPSNEERVAMINDLAHLGYKTFVSIEPIITFPMSLQMILETCKNNREYRIGLMSGVKKEEYYNKYLCQDFIEQVLTLQKQYSFEVVWKHSIKEYYHKHFPNSNLI